MPASAFRPRLDKGRAGCSWTAATALPSASYCELFLPDQLPKGLAVSFHGGYWLALDKIILLAFRPRGVCHGYAVAVPSYSLSRQRIVASRETAAAISVPPNWLMDRSVSRLILLAVTWQPVWLVQVPAMGAS